MGEQGSGDLDASGRTASEQNWLLAGSILLTLISFLANLFGAKRLLLAVRDFSRRISEHGIVPLSRFSTSGAGQAGQKGEGVPPRMRSVEFGVPVPNLEK